MELDQGPEEVLSPDTSTDDKPKTVKRGRKQDNSLPPSRSRDVQRAFRARKAEHVANLEARVKQLEEENTALRARLGEGPRPVTPARLSPDLQSGGLSRRESETGSPAPSPGVWPSGPGGQGTQEGYTNQFEQGDQRWGNQGRGMALQSQYAALLPPGGTSQFVQQTQQQQHQMQQAHQNHLQQQLQQQQQQQQHQAIHPQLHHLPPIQIHHSVAPSHYAIPTSALLPLPLGPPPRDLSPESQPRGSPAPPYNPNYAASPTFWPTHPSTSFSRTDASGLPPLPPPSPFPLATFPPSSTPSLIPTSRKPPRLPPTLRGPAPSPDIERLLLVTGCDIPSDAVNTSTPYSNFCRTLLRGLEVTGKGPSERISWTPEERRALDAAQGEDCCGGIVDCSGPLFEDASGGTMPDGFVKVRQAWERIESLVSPHLAPEVLANMLLDQAGKSGKTSLVVSGQVRCEDGVGVVVRERAVESLRMNQMNVRSLGGGEVKTEQGFQGEYQQKFAAQGTGAW